MNKLLVLLKAVLLVLAATLQLSWCAVEDVETSKSKLERDLAIFAGSNILNDYLQGKQFGQPGPCPAGVDCGPCPNFGDCRGDIQNAPDYIKDIIIEDIPTGCIFSPGTVDRKIKDLVLTGIFDVWDLECVDMNLHEVTFVDFGYKDALPSLYQTKIDVKDLRIGCTGSVRARDMTLNMLECLVGNPRVDDFQSILTLDRNALGAPGEGKGISAQFGMRFETDDENPSEQYTFQNSFPYRMDFMGDGGSQEVLDRSGNGACNILIPEGGAIDIDMQNLQIAGIGGILSGILSLVIDALDSLIINLFKTLIEGIICEVIVQLAYIDGDTSKLGGINLELDAMNTQVLGYVDAGFKERVDIQEAENFILATRTDIVPEKAINFKEDDFFESVSFGINEVLGGLSSDPDYAGQLVINQVVDLLLNSTDGVFDVPDIKERFKLEDYPNLELLFAASGFRLGIKSFRIGGLNTFNSFRVLDNGFALPGSNPIPPEERYTYTVENEVEMGSLTFDATMTLQFIPGSWVRGGNFDESVVEEFDVHMDFTDLNVTLAAFLLIRPDLMLDVQVGQIFAKDADLINCAGKILDHFNISHSKLSFGNINSPSVDNLGSLGGLITEIMTVVNSLADGGLEHQLPFIIEGGVRPFINDDLLEGAFLDPDTFCEVYDNGIVYDPPSFQVANQIAFGFTSDVIKTVIGGDPIDDNDADINSIIDIFIQYFFIDNPDLAIEELVRLDRGDYQLADSIDFDVKIENSGDFLNVSFAGPILLEVDSIGQLLVETVELSPGGQTDPYAAEVTLQWGYYNGAGTKAVNPISISLPIKIDSEISGVKKAEEDFAVQLDVSLDIHFLARAEIDISRTFQLTFNELMHSACMFAVLNSKELPILEMTVNDFVFSFPGTISDDTALGRNITLLQQEADANPDFIEYVLNYVLGRVAEETQALANSDFDPPFEIETCLTAPSPFGNSTLGTGIPVPDIGAINEMINDATTEQPDPRLVASASEFESGLVPDGDDVFDITAETSGFLDAVAGAFTPDTVRDFIQGLANATVDPNRSSIFDPLIEVLRAEDDNTTSLVLDIGTLGGLNFDPEIESLIEGLRIEFYPLVISNIDQFTTVEVLQPFKDAQFTAISDFEYTGDKKLAVTFGMEFQVDGVVVDSTEPFEKQVINTTVELSNLAINLMTTGAISPQALRDMFIGDLLSFDVATESFVIRDEGVECILPQAFYPGGLSFQQLQFRVADQDVSKPQTVVDGNLLSSALVGIIDSFLEIFLAAFTKQIPNVTQGPLRKFLNDKITEFMLSVNEKECDRFDLSDLPNFDSLPTKDIFNFGTSPFSNQLDDFIQGDVLAPGKPFDINGILKQFADLVGAKQTLLDQQEIIYNKQNLGTVSAAIGNFELPTLGTPAGAEVESLKLLYNEPFGAEFPRRTVNSIKFKGNAQSTFRLAYAADGLFEPSNSRRRLEVENQRMLQGPFLEHISDSEVYNDLTIGIDLHNLYVELVIDIGLDIPALLGMSAGNLLDLYIRPTEVSCYLAIFAEEGLRPQSVIFNFTELGLNVECESECTSPFLDFLNTGGGAETSPTVNEALTSGLRAVIDLATALLQESGAEEYIDTAILIAREECIGLNLALPEIPLGEEIVHAGMYMLYVGFGVLGCFAVFFATCFPRHEKAKSAIIQSAEKLALSGNDVNMDYINQKLLPLVKHPAIGKKARFFIPLWLLIAAIFFIVANFFSNGADVILILQIFGDTTKPIRLIDFTLERSIDDAWNSGAYFLGVVIAVASGFWPYTKLILLYVCWLAPATVLKASSRGRMAEILDSLGKWSLVDAYVLILLQVAFRIYLTSTAFTAVDFLPADIITVDVAVRPGFGIFGFLAGTIISLLTNHCIIHYHRKAVAADEERENQIKGFAPTDKLVTKRTRLFKHRFFIDDEKYSYGYGKGLQVVAIFMFGLSILLIAGGIWLDLLTFKFEGIVGLLLNVLDPASAISTNSAMSVVAVLPEGQGEEIGAQLGVVFLQLVYVIFVVVTPICLMICFSVLLFAKLTLKEQKTIFFVTEIIAAWEALIILVLSCIAAVFQIGQMADFIAKSATNNLCGFLEEQLIGFGVEGGDAKCLDVIAIVEPAGYVLIIGSFLLILTSLVFFRICHVAIDDREILTKYKVARKEGNKLQMEEIKARAHHPMKIKGIILGPLIRNSLVRFPVRRRKDRATASVAPSFPQSASFSQPSTVSHVNPMFGGTAVDGDDIEV